MFKGFNSILFEFKGIYPSQPPFFSQCQLPSNIFICVCPIKTVFSTITLFPATTKPGPANRTQKGLRHNL